MILIPNGLTREMTDEEFLGEPLVYKDKKKQAAFEKKLITKFKSSGCHIGFQG